MEVNFILLDLKWSQIKLFVPVVIFSVYTPKVQNLLAFLIW